MRILALNAYHGGSHEAFLEGWIRHSRHEFTMLTLPAYKWKWRMRHAAVTFAEQIAEQVDAGSTWDRLFCTDMLNLAEFRGLCPRGVRQLPAVAYFHENQLTYPVREPDERDLHFAFTNFTTALSAEVVWFNSQFHRSNFLASLQTLLRRMPDCQPLSAVERIAKRSQVHEPGIMDAVPRSKRIPGPLHILWAARWEHDKDPYTFFEALEILRRLRHPFRLSVLGQSFGDVPPCFPAANSTFQDHIVHWGFLSDSDAYRAALAAADVVVSTADHEFFGLAMVEAVAAGCFPLAPFRLAYPEILGEESRFFHDGTAAGLAMRLTELSGQLQQGDCLCEHATPVRKRVQRFVWRNLARRMDEAIERDL